ncbi:MULTISPECIES: hypothetical protein [unclassified Streptomyces]|uniref:hypothetical protein n=1 Tax=unclassified Streptomyces TaxID=2593676 RepID=UPI002E16C72D|nr:MULTISPECIES: hypothetical protein [unclassified Streptomyces]
MSAPLVVNTTDGTCWTRRASTRGGLALYAMAEVPSCPDVVMATYEELVEHGIAGEADALPMPVAPASQVGPIAHAAKNTDLLLADATERRRAAEWPWDMWCRICLVRLTSHRTEADALEAADRHVLVQHAPQAEVHQLMAAGGLVELERLRARVAELEPLRAKFADAAATVAELVVERGKRMKVEHALRDRIAELEVDRAEVLRQEATNLRRIEREAIPHGATGTRTGVLKAALILDERAEDLVAGRAADRLTELFAPTQSLREGETGGAS